MTEEKKIEKIKKAHKQRENAIRATQQQSHFRPDVSDKSTDAIKKYAHSIAKTIRPDYEKSPDQMDSEEVRAYFEEGVRMAEKDIGRELYNSLDKIVYEEIEDKGLEKLLTDEETINTLVNAAGKDGKEIMSYLELKSIEGLLEQYEKTGKLPEDENFQRRIMSYAQKAMSDEAVERMKKLGYTDKKSIEIARNLTALSLAKGSYPEETVRKYAVLGVKEDMKKMEEKSGKEKAYKSIRGALKKLAESDDPKTFERAVNYTLRAAA